jgi:DNA-binding NarL/FixJ family response regulator
MAATRIVVVDDHPLIREGVRALLSSIDGLEVVGEAADGDGAMEVVRRERPDVVLMDLHMPGTDGFAAIRRIATELPDVAVLVVTMLDDDASIMEATRAGARGYIVKGADQQEIRRAIEAVARDEAIFGPTVAARVLASIAEPVRQPATAFPELTQREREILDRVAAGQNNAAIARDLYISPHTVANHVSNILLKLHTGDRSSLIVKARRAGFGRADD